MYPANPTFVDNADSSIMYTDPAQAHQDGNLSTRAYGYVSITDAYAGTLAVTTAPGMSFEFIFYGLCVLFDSLYTYLSLYRQDGSCRCTEPLYRG